MPPTQTFLNETVTRLYSDHQSWLHGWLRRKLGCTHQAADLTQDTFIRILAVNNKQGGLNFSEPRAFIPQLPMAF